MSDSFAAANPNLASEATDLDRLWNFSDPQGSEQRFREALATARRSDSAAATDLDYQIQILTQIARTEGLQRQFDAANATLDEALALLTAETKTARVRYLLERGRVFNSAGEKQQAAPLFLEAWELAQTMGNDHLAVDAAHMLGICEEPSAALSWNERALQVAEASTQPRARRWLATLYNNLGWTYHDQGDCARALELFQRAVEERRSQQQPRETRIAEWCVARALRSLGRVEEALTMQQALKPQVEAAGDSDGFVSEELGECLLALGRANEAQPHFARAHEELAKDPWLAANEPQRLERLALLGKP